MNIFKVGGKFLDQPLLVAKFNKAVPVLLTSAGTLYCGQKIHNALNENKKNTAIKTSVTMGFTILSALMAPKITNKLFKITTKNIKEIKNSNTKLINDLFQTTKQNEQTIEILNKAKEKVISYKELKYLYEELNNTKVGNKFLNKLIPNPENITSKEIFSEIGRLSLLGLIPVIGGITGGIVADKLTTEDWKDKIPNKIKEGSYQYLANIFLCNVGAGLALNIMEKQGVKSKSSRALGMIGGIILMGVLGGSFIANIIGNKIINPIFGEKSQKGVYNERTPEPLDIGLHVDDIATVAVMSGLKWIEPALPIMYSISGYRAGIGYRNKKCNEL